MPELSDKDLEYIFDERVGIRHFDGNIPLIDAVRSTLEEMKSTYGEKVITEWYHRHTSKNDLFALA